MDEPIREDDEEAISPEPQEKTEAIANNDDEAVEQEAPLEEKIQANTVVVEKEDEIVEESQEREQKSQEKVTIEAREPEGDRVQEEETHEQKLNDEAELAVSEDETSVSKENETNIEEEKPREPTTKKRPPRRQIHNNDMMIAEEDTFAEELKSPGGPPHDFISRQMHDNDKMIIGQEPDIIKPTTPVHVHTHDQEHDHRENEDIEEEQEIKLTREKIIKEYQILIEERDKNLNINNTLHHKLADYFRKRQKDDAQQQQQQMLSSQDQEQRYTKYLTNIDELHKQLDRQREEFEEQKRDLKRRCEEQQRAVQQERMRYLALKRDTALKSMNSHTGKSINPKEIDEYFEKEKQKEQEVIQVRLENIKLKNQLKKKETQLRAKEELGEGLHLIDFEQLKIENQTYNEKIEERNEELMKLKRKINETVQILTHVKEKLKFVMAQNEREKKIMDESEEQVKKKRDHLNGIKKSRDTLRVDNNNLKQNSGLLGNTQLLRDFEKCVDENDRLHLTIEQLKQRHAELILDTRTIKQKITQTKSDK